MIFQPLSESLFIYSEFCLVVPFEHWFFHSVNYHQAPTRGHVSHVFYPFLLEFSYFFKNFYCIFFHYHLVPLYHPPRSPQCCPRPWVLYPFCSIPPPLSLAGVLLSIHESVSILLVTSVCSLDSTYERNQMVLVFLWVAYFTQHNVLQVHPCCPKGYLCHI